jgi:heptosyltransferase-2
MPRSLSTDTIAPDCRHYRGDKPCEHNRLCAGCEHYAPHTHRICIIKLAALGDVLRTLCILPRLRRDYPDAQITWVTTPAAARMIEHHPQIDRTLVFDALNCMVLSYERFDLAICLDKEPQPCAMVMQLRATTKLGVGLSVVGTPIPLNTPAMQYLHLGLSDDLKFNQNRKSYPKLVYEGLGWKYAGECYELPVLNDARTAAHSYLAARGWDAARPTIGINVGAGDVFANKMWPAERIASLVPRLLADDMRPQVVLLGGKAERPITDDLIALLAERGVAQDVIDGGTDHDEQTFIGIVDQCDVLLSGDTMAMHVAIARKRHVVVLFGPTCQQEIDVFGRGEKLIATLPCAPCYKRVCDHHDACIDAITLQSATQAVGRVLRRGIRREIPLRQAG